MGASRGGSKVTDALGRLSTALAGRYQVEREIGRGGMATVYVAQDLKHDRRVALKVLHPHLASTLGPERFLREIQIAARLQHPHILPLFDSGEADTLLYYVMPFVDGQSLRDRLNQVRQIPIDEAVKIARDVAAALDYAHRHGVVHRDIKPENVMLSEGEAIVTDFGIAKAVSAAGGESLTQVGLAVGTPAYMSPEQAAGEGEPDGRSDVYSLGCVLYEMLAGSAPFTGSSVQALITKRFTEPPPAVRAIRKEVTAELEQVVTRALARDPAERFATASQVVQALGSPKVVTPPNATPLTTPVVAQKQSIAVLSFTDMSPQKDQDYFCEGIAEEIINALSRIDALHVASRTSTFAFKGKSEDMGEIGKKLKVATVLEGSVRKAGNRLRVSAQLVSVSNGYQLWSERYDRELEDVFAIQDEIAGSIVKALRVVLSDKEKRAIEKAPTANVQAYDFYLRGRQYFHQWRKKGVEYARRMFERAMEIDPDYALAHAGAADCCSSLFTWWDASRSNLEGADTYSRRALELDPELAEGHAARGLALTLRKEYDEAEAEFRAAMRLDPKLFEARFYFARACLAQGKYQEAAALFEQSSELRPEDYQSPILVAEVYQALGRPADAEAANRRGVQLAEERLTLNPDESRALVLGAVAHCRLGNKARGLDLLDQATVLDPDDSGVLYNVACGYATAGQPEEAITCLENAIRNGFGHWEWLHHDSDLESLRGHPRFQALLARE
ncbi:MAG TPA: protein kinase [Gemmatimonadales bacterium]|nr:protein kinase [Gemmatimonadales bacterium]